MRGYQPSLTNKQLECVHMQQWHMQQNVMSFCRATQRFLSECMSTSVMMAAVVWICLRNIRLDQVRLVMCMRRRSWFNIVITSFHDLKQPCCWHYRLQKFENWFCSYHLWLKAHDRFNYRYFVGSKSVHADIIGKCLTELDYFRLDCK